MRTPLVAAGMLTAGLGLACGKSRLDPTAEPAPAPSNRWDPPTAAFGFQPVRRLGCMPAGEEDAIVATNELLFEEIARAPNGASLRHLATDATGVYWTQVSDGRGAVYAASRSGAAGSFRVDPVAHDEVEPDEIAVSEDAVYWTVGERDSHAGIRFAPKTTGVVDTLLTEAQRPQRLVANGESVFWVAAPNHLREARSAGRRVRTLLTMTLMPGLLAADADAVYAFTNDQTLLRIGRDGSRPIVLVSTTETPPVDIVVEGSWVYWLEQGPAIETCTKDGQVPCRSRGYEMKRITEPHPSGTLRRVPRKGGPIEDVATHLPNVERLAFRSGVAWVTTDRGVLRVPAAPCSSPRGHVTMEPMGGVHRRFATIGDALVLGTDAFGVSAGGSTGAGIFLAAP